MLRITGLSLLLGLGILVAGLTLVALPTTTADHRVSPIHWNADDATGTVIDGVFHLTLNDHGTGRISLPDAPFSADLYPFMHIALGQVPHNSIVRLKWRTDSEEQNKHRFLLKRKSLSSLWIASRELEGWTGEIQELQLIILGPAGSTVIVHDFSVLPASIGRQLAAIYCDLTAYVPWQRASMNSHTGVTKVSSFYPALLGTGLLILSLLAYGTILLVSRRRLNFNWKVVALIFLTCWICLDLVWQKQLMHQVADTHRSFNGKTSEQKLTVGPNRGLFKFVLQVRQEIKPRDARIFVSSSDEYSGLRGAYYLYPFNVYWSLDNAGLPPLEYLRPGDYLMLVRPSKLRLLPGGEQLRTWQGDIDVEPLISHRKGILVRVK